MLLRTLVLGSLLASSAVMSAPVAIDTSTWQSDLSPSTSRLSKNDVWLGTESNTPKKIGNSSGSLISDFTTSGDFLFSGAMTPTFATNASCEAENTCNDNDILGIVFGWQDANNHYRLGFSQGDSDTPQASSDITGRNGLFLVREFDGRSSTVAHWSDVFWQDEQKYDFSVGRLGDMINFNLTGFGLNTAQAQSGTTPSEQEFQTQNASLAPFDIAFELLDTTFMSGKVGVYTESQTAMFSGLNVDTFVKVSAPPIFVTMLLMFFWVNSRRKNTVSAG